ncbi:TetR/AcrR family transcriptional regulator [Tsukamurella sp. NPDC003166]|uniref:TetR/AcrR family transcriptional regulator n=1 Tax=Tsukamurella sp. NPDC003166 TaxID=3154444 RepID=UPI00339EAC89
MSPRALDPAVRNAVMDAAIRILGTEGRSALTARRLARETGTSTTVVYTYFGSMDDLHRHVRRHAITALLAALDVAETTDDPVADLARAAAIQVDHGCRQPAMYRIMFVDQPPDDTDDPGTAVFERFVGLVDRCIRGGRFHPGESHHPAMWAGQLWTAGHGAVMSALTGLLPHDQVRSLHSDMIHRLCVGYGDDRR